MYDRKITRSESGVFRHLDGHFVVGMTGINFKKDSSVEHFHAGGDIFQSEPGGSMIQAIEFSLDDTLPVVVQPEITVRGIGILGKVDEASVAVLHDVIDQLLDDPEDMQFLFQFQALAVIMKTYTRVQVPAAVDLLKQVAEGAFQSEVFQRRRHHAVADVADQLDGIIDNLFGAEDGLQLGGRFLIHDVFVQV